MNLKNAFALFSPFGGLRKQQRAIALANDRLDGGGVPEVESVLSATSVSDKISYKQVVELANKDPDFFEVFRAHPDWTEILDHVSKQQGREYLDILVDRHDISIDQVRGLKKQFHFGSPKTERFGRYGSVSPTLFRYLKVASDLRILFPDLANPSIAEVGIGWGGQALVLSRLMEIKEFLFFDLPEVNMLAEKILRTKAPSLRANYFGAGENPPQTSPDLFISNYAFSELNRKSQDLYLSKIIQRSARGYVTWNEMSPDGYSLGELLQMIPGASAIEERPLTSERNSIIVWGHNPVSLY